MIQNYFWLKKINFQQKFICYFLQKLILTFKKIALKIDRYTKPRIYGEKHDRYYIHKIKPVFVEEQIYYEVTLSMAYDYASKFDRIIAFSKHELIDHYAIDAVLVNTHVNIYNKDMPINIIKDWK